MKHLKCDGLRKDKLRFWQKVALMKWKRLRHPTTKETNTETPDNSGIDYRTRCESLKADSARLCEVVREAVEDLKGYDIHAANCIQYSGWYTRKCDCIIGQTTTRLEGLVKERE